MPPDATFFKMQRSLIEGGREYFFLKNRAENQGVTIFLAGIADEFLKWQTA